MAGKLFKIEVHTPYRLFFSSEVEAVVADLPDGQIGIRAGRAPFASPLKICALRLLFPDGIWKEAAVSGGVVEVNADGVVVLAGAAEWPEEIDRQRAEESAERARDLLSQDLMRYEADRARASLSRALNRLAVAGRASARSPQV